MYETTQLRDTPATENEIAKILAYRARGASPGNPKWYKAPTLPKQFVFKAGAKPVFPNYLTVQKKPKHIIVRLSGGPFKGAHLDLSICDNSAKTGETSTLEIKFAGQTGRYIGGKWEPKLKQSV